MSGYGSGAGVCALALVGMPGAGKSSCAWLLQELGFASFRFGSIVIQEVEQRGLAVTPENERQIREDLRAREGMEVMAKRALPTIQQLIHERDCVVMDGLYSQSEYRFLKERFGDSLVTLAIVAPRQLRYQRLAAREERLLTAEEAERRDFQEVETLEKCGPIALADYTIVNDESEAKLRATLVAILKELSLISK